MHFRDRRAAGRRTGELVRHLADEQPVVLGLPRGGVPVAYEVAEALGAPLDVIVVRKLGLPSQPELAMGAIGEGGVRVLNPSVIANARVSDADIAVVEAREQLEVQRRAERYRGRRPMVALEARTVVVVDDGLATGSTARAAVQIVRSHRAARVVVAVPVASRHAVSMLAREADEVLAATTPEQFHSLGEWYDNFTQTGDEEVVALLARATRA